MKPSACGRPGGRVAPTPGEGPGIARRRGGRKFWTMRFPRFSTREFTMKESVFQGFDTRFIKLEFDAEPICRLGFLIASRNKVLRAISRFRAPPRNCRKCENCVVFAISFERGRAFKFCFEGSKAHVLHPQNIKNIQDFFPSTPVAVLGVQKTELIDKI